MFSWRLGPGKTFQEDPKMKNGASYHSANQEELCFDEELEEIIFQGEGNSLTACTKSFFTFRQEVNKHPTRRGSVAEGIKN